MRDGKRSLHLKSRTTEEDGDASEAKARKVRRVSVCDRERAQKLANCHLFVLHADLYSRTKHQWAHMAEARDARTQLLSGTEFVVTDGSGFVLTQRRQDGEHGRSSKSRSGRSKR